MVCYYPLSQSALGLSHVTARIGIGGSAPEEEGAFEPQTHLKVVVVACGGFAHQRCAGLLHPPLCIFERQ